MRWAVFILLRDDRFFAYFPLIFPLYNGAIVHRNIMASGDALKPGA